MKKYLLPALFVLLFAGNTQAQYVTIPDANFVSWLKSNGYSQCFSGNQLDTSCPKVLNATNIRCWSKSIADFNGIQYFKKLDTLSITYNLATSLPELPSLLELECDKNLLKTLPALPEGLVYLRCDYDSLTALPPLPSSLTRLQCSSNLLTSIPALPPSLIYCWIDGNQLTVCPSLPSSITSLRVGDNHLTSLPALPPLLTEFSCDQNELSSIPTLPTGLTTFLCYSNHLTTLPSLPNSITWFNCGYNPGLALPSVLPSSLRTFGCAFNGWTDLPVLPASLTDLYCNDNQLTFLPALPASLKQLNCQNNLLTTLPQLPSSLTALVCSFNQLSTLPVFSSSLTALTCTDNNLTGLPAMPVSMAILKLSNNHSLYCLPPFKYFTGHSSQFLIDGTGINCLPNKIIPVGYVVPMLDTMRICSPFNANGCDVGWNIYGSIYKDGNADCKQQTSEEELTAPVKVNLYQGSSLVQSAYFKGGKYTFDTDLLPYRVEIDTTNFPLLVMCPVTGDTSVNVTPLDSFVFGVNFGVRCKPGYDLEARNIVDSLFRPGNISTVHITAGELSRIYGAGCMPVSGTVTVAISGPVKYRRPALGALTPSYVSNSNFISWDVADFNSIDPYKAFNLVVQTDTTASMGSNVCFSVVMSSNTPGDRDLLNNTLVQCYRVRSSYDPNDKQAYPSGNTDTSTKWITYTVRFQNTGNDTAIHIYVLDTLDANIDVASFQLLASSHKNVTQIYGNGIVKFNFPNIMLPDSNVNEELSHGYVQYKVKLKDDLALGTQIFNTAYIYFDFNAPVVTNTTLNTITTEVATAVSSLSFGEGLGVKLFPNPATNQLTISSTGFAAQWITVYDVNGRRVTAPLSFGEGQGVRTIDISALTGGIYFIELRNANSTARTRFVKM